MSIKRFLASELRTLARGYPIIAITGPRQSGKTTLARLSFGDKPYVNFEDPLERAAFHADPKGYLARYSDGAIFDEVQHIPELFSFLQVRVDDDARMGLYVLTGSQQLGFHGAIAQSLAGRVAMAELLPFSFGELQDANREPASLDEAIYRGSYPPVIVREVSASRWYADYIATYIQRDVRQLLNIQNLDTFTTFVRLCAGHVGQLVNTTALGEACGVDHKTVKAWLGVLQATYVIFLLQPHHQSFKKRLVKTPKLYFYDTGLACNLLGIAESAQVAVHPARGALVENWVVSELLKARLHRGLRSNLYFWRNNTGLEVDLLAEQALGIVPIEVKSGQSIHPEHLKGLRAWCALAEERCKNPTVIYGGVESYEVLGIKVLGWRQVTKLGGEL